MNRIPIVEHVFQHALANPDKKAILSIDREITYDTLAKTVNAYACFLRDAGLAPQGIVVARATNTIDYAVLYLGVHLAGGVICSLEKSSPVSTITAVADQVCARLVIDSEVEVDGRGWRRLRKTVFEDAANYMDAEQLPFPDLESSADILFTTGTTGVSKGVELSHKALTATAENLICGCGYTEDMLLAVPGPLNHANAIRKLYTTLMIGGTVSLLNGLMNLRAFFNMLDLPYQNIACCLPPAMIRLIFTVSKDKLGDYADKISFIESASAPLPEVDRQHLCRLLPNTRLIINYGSSEAASSTMYDCNALPGLVNCIGRPMPNSEILIVDDDRNIIHSSMDHMGLIACRGDVVMKGYINAPELTKEVLIDGVLYTNDIGYIDKDGFVYIIGRKGDVINVGGLKVAPGEVEDAALEYPGINDCICISAEDRISGHVPKLLYVAEEEINLREFSSFLATKLESYKIPKQFEKTDRIARTYNGKLDRKFYRKDLG